MSIKKFAVLVFCVFVGGILISSPCNGKSKYNSNYEKCISESGGRGDIEAAKQACKWASGAEDANTKNGCSIWIGDPSNSSSTTIKVSQTSGTVSVAYYGMCTDYEDTTLDVQVVGACGAFGTAPKLTRGGWGNPSSIGSTLDVDKLKSCMGKCGKQTFNVQIKRVNGESGHVGYTTQNVTIDLGGEECPPDQKVGKCENMAPASYTNSNEWEGTTSLDFWIRNNASRLSGNWMGQWGEKDIWAMPTDTIEWRTCYYPGVQKTYNTKVTRVKGKWEGYYSDKTPEILEKTTYTCINPLWSVKEFKELHEVARPWENKIVWSGDASNDTNAFQGDGGKDKKADSKPKEIIVSLTTKLLDAGETFSESVRTGKPIWASIESLDPTSDKRGCECKKCTEKETKQDCDFVDGVKKCTEYEVCKTWETHECSCCDADWGEGFSDNPGPTEYTSHKNTFNQTLYHATVDFSTTGKGPLSVSLPYNFVVSTAVETDKTLVYSGAKDEITVKKVTTTVHERDNSVTLASYATEVPTAQVNLYAYVSSDGGGTDSDKKTTNDVCKINGKTQKCASESLGSDETSGGTLLGGSGDVCAELGSRAKQCVHLESTTRSEEKGNALNKYGYLTGDTDVIWQNITYNAFDAAAGDYMCFASSVSPYSVAGDTDMVGGNGMWTYSKPQCAIIAKRPTFQVWGGSLYSVGDIKTIYNTKLKFYAKYRTSNNIVPKSVLTGGGTEINFTPWVEESLMLKNGTTDSVASGAATALNNNDAGAGVTSLDLDICKNQSALSFANYSATIGGICNGVNAVGASSIDSGIKDREKLIEYWMGKTPAPNASGDKTYNLNNFNSVGSEVASASGEKIRFAYTTGKINLSGNNVPKKTTYLIKSESTVTITGNIKYDSSNYSGIIDIPKVIIYAKNVDINCSVTEVDAIIITKPGGTVKTCSEHNMATDSCDVSKGAEPCKNPLYSNQLKIFGMVITDNIELGRTYGSAANKDGNQKKDGIPSDGVAAEIFDFDTSILMWSEFMAGSEESDTQQIVYQQELAPRY